MPRWTLYTLEVKYSIDDDDLPMYDFYGLMFRAVITGIVDIRGGTRTW